MKKTLLLIIIFFQISIAVAKEIVLFGGIQGVVLDNINQSPIDGAVVTLAKLELTKTTNHKGEFSLDKLPKGRYQLNIDKEGFTHKELIVNVLNEKMLTLKIELSVASFELETVTVKTDRGISAASSQLLNALDFSLRPRNSAQDMMRNVPGLFTAQHAGGGKAEQIFLRGFDADHGTDVAAFVDGIPVNMPSHGHGQGYLDLHFLIPETVQNASLTKGPYFAQFGDFATAGAISFKTFDKLDKNSFQTEITSTPTTARSLMSNRNVFMYQLPFKNDKISSYIAADYIFSNGYFEQKQDFLRRNIFSKTTANLLNNNKISFLISDFSSKWNASGQIPERAVAAKIISRFGGIDNSEGGATSRQNLSLTHQKIWDNSQLETQVFASNYDFKLFSNFTFFLNDAKNGDGIEQIDHRKIIGLNTKYSLAKNNQYLTFGIGVRSDFIENQLWHDVQRVRLDNIANANIKEQNLNFYIKDEIKITEKFKAEIGLRANQFFFNVIDNIETNTSHENYSGKNHQFGLHPKINLSYSFTDNYKIFFNVGRGFHSNDARVVVQDKNNHRLPVATGSEVGFLLKPTSKTVFNVAFWGLDLENELVFIGDEGTTENNGASRRYGVDIGGRYTINKFFTADADVNISRSLFVEKAFGKIISEDYFVPLAPRLTSTGGLTYRQKAIEASLRYRHLAARPANESGSVMARAYTILDLNAAYSFGKNRIALSVENLLNQAWNEAQFDTESRLFSEPAPVSEIHFTAGTPVALKLIYTRNF